MAVDVDATILRQRGAAGDLDLLDRTVALLDT